MRKRRLQEEEAARAQKKEDATKDDGGKGNGRADAEGKRGAAGSSRTGRIGHTKNATGMGRPYHMDGQRGETIV